MKWKTGLFLAIADHGRGWMVVQSFMLVETGVGCVVSA